MKENIVLSEYPQASGAYYFISNNEVIYIGSSKNLYFRMADHKKCIKKGFSDKYKTDLYQFLQSNEFEVQFQLTDNYRQLEQELIEKHQPIFNARRANTGISHKGREAEYDKEYYQKYKEEISERQKQYHNQYDNQLCNYNGKVLTLESLRKRFAYRGIEHPTLEAKKFLINKDNIQEVKNE